MKTIVLAVPKPSFSKQPHFSIETLLSSIMLHSIRWRLVASTTVLTLLTVSLLGVTVLSLMQRYIEQQEREHLRINAEALARQAQRMIGWELPGPPLPLLDLAHTAATLGNFRVRIFDQTDTLLADSGTPTDQAQYSWFAPALIPPSAEPLPPGNIMIVGGSAINQQIVVSQVPLETAPFSGSVQAGVIQRVGDEPVAVIRQSPSLWGPVIEFAVMPNLPVPAAQAGVNDAITILTSVHDLTTNGIEITDTLLSAGMATSAVWQEAAPSINESVVRSTQSVTEPIRLGEVSAGYVELSESPSFGNEALSAVRRLFLMAATGVSLLAVVVGLVVSRGLTAPIQDLSVTTAQMNDGNLSARVPVHGNDEIGMLAVAFNRMAAALEESFASLAAERDALRRFVADASHELRTPITALRSFNELLRGAADGDPLVRQEFLREGQRQIERLEQITGNLLNLSRLEGGLVELRRADHDLAELLSSVAARFRFALQEHAIELQLTAPPKATTINCDRQQIESALGNLLDNAIKFTPNGGRIELGATVSSAAVEIWVKDSGVGIDPAEMPLIFDRFHRGKNAQHPGSGLGLAIAKRMIEMHHGDIRVTSQPGVETRFTIHLPQAA